MKVKGGKIRIWGAGAALALLLLCPPAARAQDLPQDSTPPPPAARPDPLQDQEMGMGMNDSFDRMAKIRPPDVNLQDLGSLLFSPWQFALLQEAKRGFMARPPTTAEVQHSAPGSGNAPEDTVHPSGPREISLGGIAFASAKDWTIWLNGQRVTPKALPEQVLDIKVHDDFIELKWYDTSTNLIYPIRLRPHQRFNIDSRIFLPGAGI